jgi:hypothetical protein
VGLVPLGMMKKKLTEALLPLLSFALDPSIKVEAVTLAHIMAEKTWRIGAQLVDGRITSAQFAELPYINDHIGVECEVLLLSDDHITTRYFDLMERCTQQLARGIGISIWPKQVDTVLATHGLLVGCYVKQQQPSTAAQLDGVMVRVDETRRSKEMYRKHAARTPLRLQLVVAAVGDFFFVFLAERVAFARLQGALV